MIEEFNNGATTIRFIYLFTINLQLIIPFHDVKNQRKIDTDFLLYEFTVLISPIFYLENIKIDLKAKTIIMIKIVSNQSTQVFQDIIIY